ncbi:MAG TPA: hypothetical protein VKF37_19975 [Chloroflexota bacterium]|nr:hypothetical protein [Chloroflexota bacterium]
MARRRPPLLDQYIGRAPATLKGRRHEIVIYGPERLCSAGLTPLWTITQSYAAPDATRTD